MSTEIYVNFALKLIAGVILVAVPILLKPLIRKLADWLQIKINCISKEDADRIFEVTMKLLEKIVTTTVEYLEQEYGSEIRKGIVEGINSREELCELKDKAIEIVKSQITDSTLEILETKIPDVSAYIDNLVSEKVREMKLVDSKDD